MQKLKIFYCYEREDRQLLNQLNIHLSALKREYQITTWSKQEILPGMEMESEIVSQLETADIILLLISPEFIHSDFCYCIEMEHALQRHRAKSAQVIPILLRSTYWENTPFHKLKALPTNAKPVTSWRNRDEAFQDIARGIRRYLETAHKSQQTQTIARPTEKTVINSTSSNFTAQREEYARQDEEQPRLKRYIYISDNKLDQLEQQIGRQGKGIAPFQNRFAALEPILARLHKGHQIWDIHSERSFKTHDYIAGTCLMRWGSISWSTKVSFFYSTDTSPILLMAGSFYHLQANQSPKELSLSSGPFSMSASDLPGIMSAIEFAAEHGNLKWSEGIGSLSDYLFALGFVQGKFIHHLKIKQLSSAFPEQLLEFTALVLKRLSPPSEQQLREFFRHNAIDKHDRDEIRRMLAGRQEILICTPLYVALGEEEAIG